MIQLKSPDSLHRSHSLKHILSLLLCITFTLGLTGCFSGSSSSSSSDDDDLVGTTMETGTVYSVSRHDRLVSTSPDPAVVSIEHELNNDERSVVLESGSADLFRSVQ